MGKLVVVDGTNIIICTGGAAPSTLTVTTSNTPPVNGAAVATIQDHKSITNVKPFGICNLQGGLPCIPKTPEPWMPGAKDVLTGESSSSFPTLTENSFLSCHQGGLIQIIAPGQSIFSIGSEYELIYDEDGRLVGYAHLHDGEVMSAFDTDGDMVWVREALEDDNIFVDIALTAVGGPEILGGIKLVAKGGSEFLARRFEKKLVTVTIDSTKHPEAARHIMDAQKVGHPSDVVIDRAGANARRTDALAGHERVPGMQLDEYPPAMFKEGGAGASVRPIDPSHNMGAGASMGNQLRNVKDGTRVRIKVK